MQEKGQEEKTGRPYLALFFFILAFTAMIMVVIFKNKILAYLGYRYLGYY
ncbi:MAG: hypothetical protein Q7J12_08960 [Syntrophales bacterium]|nr:hypothetical protein [Syntrophales bacterium]